MTVEPIKVGDTASMTKEITERDVTTFAVISGDQNPLHLDDDFAAGTVFKKRIAHGSLVGLQSHARFAARLGYTHDLQFGTRGLTTVGFVGHTR